MNTQANRGPGVDDQYSDRDSRDHPLSDDALPDDLDSLEEELRPNRLAQAARKDAEHRNDVIAQLVAARESAGLKQIDVATGIGTTQSAISDLENGRVDAKLSTLQRYARLCQKLLSIGVNGHIMQPAVLPQASEDDLDELVSQLQGEPRAVDSYRDSSVRSALREFLINARKGLKYTQQSVADAIGSTQSAVSNYESERVDPRLSTLQRYARACGMILEVVVADPSAEQNGAITSVIVPTAVSAKADAGDLAAFKMAASVSIEEVLRTLIRQANRHGRSWGELVMPSRLLAQTKGRTLTGLTTRGWIHDDSNSLASRQLTLREDAAVFIGISVRADHVRGIATGVFANALTKLHRVDVSEPSPTRIVAAVAQLISELRDSCAVDPMGIGVELSGPVDATTGTVLFAPDLSRWSTSSWTSVPLEAEIQQSVGMKTVVGNDAKAIATRELLLADAPGGQIVVNMSESTEGIGAGLIFNGQIIRGAEGESGEIGHIMVDPDGEPCRRCDRDRRGCLETLASGAAVARKLGVATLVEAAALADAQDRLARDAFHDAGELLGTVLATSVDLLNPAEVTIYGPKELADIHSHTSADDFVNGIYSALTQRGLRKLQPIRVEVADSLTGPLSAAALSINDFLTRPLEYSPDMRSRPAARTQEQVMASATSND